MTCAMISLGSVAGQHCMRLANACADRLDRVTRDTLRRVMTYKPTPIDTRGIELPSELHALTERLAENAHDLWAIERLAQGWSYGLGRDDKQRLHPCLVPYASLPDAERTFDRITALGTLKAIVALGYRIVPVQH